MDMTSCLVDVHVGRYECLMFAKGWVSGIRPYEGLYRVVGIGNHRLLH
jgi:hypothetical protein